MDVKANLKVFLKRLNNGENLDDVKHDFMQSFKSVSTEDIIKAEQDLIKDGFDFNTVHSLCDVHVSLFKEQIKKEDKFEELIKIEDHPLSILHKENELIKKEVEEYKLDKDPKHLFNLKEISKHYHKKGDLLYPLLADKYNVTGPSNLMWTKDINIRTELNKILKNGDYSSSLVDPLLDSILDMIYKEENIFLPTCAKLISYDDFMLIKHDLKDYPLILGLDVKLCDCSFKEEHITNDHITIKGGSFNINELESLLNTIPLEITFVDVNDKNKFFNLGSKVFKRPSSALGRSVYSCHPPKVVPMVKNIIDSFKDGSRDKVEVFMPKEGKNFLVSYYALRDSSNNYLGTMELVQELDSLAKYFK